MSMSRMFFTVSNSAVAILMFDILLWIWGGDSQLRQLNKIQLAK